MHLREAQKATPSGIAAMVESRLDLALRLKRRLEAWVETCYHLIQKGVREEMWDICVNFYDNIKSLTGAALGNSRLLIGNEFNDCLKQVRGQCAKCNILALDPCRRQLRSVLPVTCMGGKL